MIKMFTKLPQIKKKHISGLNDLITPFKPKFLIINTIKNVLQKQTLIHSVIYLPWKSFKRLH